MKLTVREICLFGMLGTTMFVSKLLMDFLPNIHIIGVFIVAITMVYRVKALIPLYVFVFLSAVYALFYGGLLWWIPYLYIWAVLWAMAMLIPRKMPDWLKPFMYAAVCALHGFLYGTLYAPAYALISGFSFEQMVAWIVAGFVFDITHGISNLILGFLVIAPLVMIMSRFQKNSKKEG